MAPHTSASLFAPGELLALDGLRRLGTEDLAAVELTVAASLTWGVFVAFAYVQYRSARLAITAENVGIVRFIRSPLGMQVKKRSRIARLALGRNVIRAFDTRGRAVLVLPSHEWGHHAETLAASLGVPLQRDP